MTDPQNIISRLPGRLLLVLLVSVVIFIIIDTFDLLTFDSLFQGESDSEQIERIQLVLSILFWPLIPLGLYVIYFGYRIIQSGQFPPPGTRIIRRLRIEKGNMAIARGWLAIATGLSLCGLAIYGAVIIPDQLTDLISHPKGGSLPF